MPILEILAVRLRDGVSPTDPSLLKNLSDVRSYVQSNSNFYHCIEDPSIIYIIGQWASLETHKKWLVSPERDDVLKPQEDQLSLFWMIHMNAPEKGIEGLPLKAPVMSVARLFVKSEHEEEFYRIATSQRVGLVEYAKPYPVVDGWRIDPEEGQKEFVVITGWESVKVSPLAQS